MRALARLSTLLLGLAAAVLLLAACGEGGGSLGEGVVARVGDRDLAYGDFEAFLDENVGEGGTGLDNEVLAALFEQFLEEELLLELAVDRELVHAASTRRRAAEALLLDEGDMDISDEAIALYYRENAVEFELGERVRLRQILLEDLEQAEDVKALLDSGQDFVAVVRGLGDPGALAGIDQGELGRADLPEEFVVPVFGLQAGEVSEILEADYGFHIFQVVERFDAARVPLEQVAGAVRLQLQTEQANESIARMLGEAQERYNVQVATTSLPFRYPPSSD